VHSLEDCSFNRIPPVAGAEVEIPCGDSMPQALNGIVRRAARVGQITMREYEFIVELLASDRRRSRPGSTPELVVMVLDPDKGTEIQPEASQALLKALQL